MKVLKKKNWFMHLKSKTKGVFNANNQNKIKEFFSKFSKAILTMIAVLPIGGLLIILGKIIGPLGLGQIASVSTTFNKIGSIIEQLGWIPFNNLGILFALAIGGTWAKNRAGGAFAAVFAYLILLTIGANIFVTRNIKEGDETIVQFMNYIIGGKWLDTRNYFGYQVGIFSLRFDAIGGIITGFLGAAIYNKYHVFDRLPKALSFFNGARFVPFMTVVIMVPFAIVLTLFWPLVQAGINAIGRSIALNNEVPFIMPFGFGFLERLLLPVGLHHMITLPMNYTSFGGTLDYTSAEQFENIADQIGDLSPSQLADFYKYIVANNTVRIDSLRAEGQEKMWLTWITAVGSVKNQWSNYAQINGLGETTETVYNGVMNTFQPVRFKVGQMITSTASLPTAAVAILLTLKKDMRLKYKSMYISGALACILTGVTEPVEFLFMYTAPIFYFVHTILTGVAFGMADVLPMRIHAFGGIEIILKYFLVAGPSSLSTNNFRTTLWYDGLFFLIISSAFALIYFVTFYYSARWLKPVVPGMYDEPTPPETSSKVSKSSALEKDQRISIIIQLLGGKENIDDVDACMTRLRVTIRDISKVNDKFQQDTGALGVVKNGNNWQIVYGPEASVIKEKVLLRLNEEEYNNE